MTNRINKNKNYIKKIILHILLVYIIKGGEEGKIEIKILRGNKERNYITCLWFPS